MYYKADEERKGLFMYQILVCDDEKDIVAALRIYLEAEGYKVFEAANGREALEIFDREEVHLVLLDIMMPDMDGITVMARLREFSNVPILMLTAKSEDADKILGLNIGADDYVTKPFHPAELMARVKSQLRRYLMLGGGHKSREELTVGGITLNESNQIVTKDGEQIALTPTEFSILKLLMENPGQVFSPNRIYSRVWKNAPYSAENTVAVHVRHLREKLEINPAEPRYIKVVWGKGYKFEGERKESI